jgi:hypothetical protein
MQVTSKQTLIFQVAGQKDYVLRPTQHPVNAPEHIRGTQLFKLATSDGTVQEFVPIAAPAAQLDDKAKAAADKAAAKAKADAEAEADAKAKAEADQAAADKKAK